MSECRLTAMAEFPFSVLCEHAWRYFDGSTRSCWPVLCLAARCIFLTREWLSSQEDRGNSARYMPAIRLGTSFYPSLRIIPDEEVECPENDILLDQDLKAISDQQDYELGCRWEAEVYSD